MRLGGGMVVTGASTTERIGRSETRVTGSRFPPRSTRRPTRRWAVGSAAITAIGLVGWLQATGRIDHVAAIVAPLAMVPAAVVDVVERRLPNRLVGGGAAIVVVTAILVWLGGDGFPVGPMAVGAGLMAGPLLVMHLVSPTSMGFGDVKAASVLGAGLGAVEPQLALMALCVGSAVTATVGLIGRRRDLPFGPGLVGGTLMTVLFVSVSGSTLVGAS